MILYILIGLVSGIISGMGIGGGTILIPALSIFYSMEQHEAQNINLIYFIPTAIIAIISHLKNGNVEKKLVPKLVVWGLIGAFAGAFIAVKMEGELLRKAFGFFLLAMGLYEIFKKQEEEDKKTMEDREFNEIKKKFEEADTKGKIDIYVSAQGLTNEQYKELLRLYPYSEIGELEKALA